MVDAIGATAYSYDANGAVRTEDGPWASDTMTFEAGVSPHYLHCLNGPERVSLRAHP